MSRPADRFEPGQRVTVTQQIPQRDGVWTIAVQGTVQRFEQKKTGSWFAHAKDAKLWLDRLVVRKDDGEIVMFNLDPYTHVEVTAAAAGSAGTAPPDPADPATGDSPADAQT
jgi:hypothetical protein